MQVDEKGEMGMPKMCNVGARPFLRFRLREKSPILPRLKTILFSNYKYTLAIIRTKAEHLFAREDTCPGDPTLSNQSQ